MKPGDSDVVQHNHVESIFENCICNFSPSQVLYKDKHSQTHLHLKINLHSIYPFWGLDYCKQTPLHHAKKRLTTHRKPSDTDHREETVPKHKYQKQIQRKKSLAQRHARFPTSAIQMQHQLMHSVTLMWISLKLSEIPFTQISKATTKNFSAHLQKLLDQSCLFQMSKCKCTEVVVIRKQLQCVKQH